MRSSWSRTHVLIRKGRFSDKEETHKEGCLMIKMEMETAVMKLEARECQGLPANAQDRAWNRYSLIAFKRTYDPYDT